MGCKWNPYLIELKKGTSIWLDLVRYSELLVVKMGTNFNWDKIVTLFCVPDREKKIISEIIAVSLSNLQNKLNVSESQAEFLLELRHHAPRQLNAQASLTVSDVRSIADFSVGFPDSVDQKNDA
ncbi:MAG: hypothetical protein V3T99_00915 [Nitrososphaerales archaeon]